MKVLALILIAVGCIFALPSAALAVTYTVNDTGDEVDKSVGVGGCETAVAGKCSLRAAIQESNSSTGVTDEIKFAAAFNGQGEDTIAIASSLPTITDPVHIDGDSGGQCTTEAGPKGPCAGVNGPASGSAILVEDDGVEIDGLAITGAAGNGGSAGIFVINGSEGFVARDNWLGVKLDGSAGANSKGIYIDPGSDGATIGGTAGADRNVFANNGFEGLDIEGASNTEVLGNYFGVKPDGATAAANNKDIEITDTVAFEAIGNEVGTTVEGEAFNTTACDGGCNVISGATFAGVDLQGNGGNEEPATGPTVLHGNYVGFTASGTEVVANGSYGVLSQKAEDVTVGGPKAGDSNFIAGGGFGIYHENGESFEAANNLIGIARNGAEVTPPGTGLFIYCLNNAEPVSVFGNLIRMEGGIGIEEKFGNAEIIQNFIVEAEYGIYALGDPPVVGNLIEGNEIGEASANGIFVESDSNEVVGNWIYGSGGAGVRVENPTSLVITTGNLIGGGTLASENTINESGGPAIQIVDESGNTEEDSFNEVGRNKGAKNAGPFIDLVGNANAGILPPSIGAAKLGGASGSGAAPGAKIRVFRKKAAEAGEIESFLGEAIADGSGNWSVTYAAAIPGETRIAATQTSEGGTSELAFATTEPAPKTGGGGGGNGGNGNGGEKPTPQTTIKKGPKAKTHSTTAKFKFVSNLSGSTFECKLDKKKFKPCRSPKTYKKLKPGKHVFKVRAVKAGVTDPTPAVRRFKVLS